MKKEYVEYEQILATHSPSDRAVLKSILDAEHITYYFDSEYVAPYVYHAIPVRLMVRKDQVEEALEILKDFELSFTSVSPLNPEDIDDDE